MADNGWQCPHFSVGTVARHRQFRLVMSGDFGDVTMQVSGVSIDSIIDRVKSRSFSCPPGMRSFVVTDLDSGEEKQVG